MDSRFALLALLALGCSNADPATKTDGGPQGVDAPADATDATPQDVAGPDVAVDLPVDSGPDVPPDSGDRCLRRVTLCGDNGVVGLDETMCGDTYYGEPGLDTCLSMSPSGYPTQSWRFEAPRAGRYTATVVPGPGVTALDGWAAALVVAHTSCDPARCLGSQRGTVINRPVSVTFEVAAGAASLLIVGVGRGDGANYGPYTLTVRAQ